jgi:hypothetical protein
MTKEVKQLFVAGVAGIILLITLAPASEGGGQDVYSLERRVNAVEQRFYSLESRLNRLEQQAVLNQRSPGAAPTPTQQTLPDTEVALLRSEIEILSTRLQLVECGVTRLDERTLSAATREARRKAGAQAADSCRQNADVPLQFPPR